MKDLTAANFGLLIAYVIPGFILLWGIEPYSATIQVWFGQHSTENASVGGFLYVTVASVGLGQLVSTVRWLTIDTLHHRSGLAKPNWNFRGLNDAVAAFDRLIEDHYRYYQFHANCVVAVSLAALLRWVAYGFSWRQLIGLILVDILLLAGSRDTLKKYYRRVEDVLAHDR